MAKPCVSVTKTDFIWLDGSFVPWDKAQVHVMSVGLHYGIGVFEGIRAYRCSDGRSAIFRLREHIRRLADSARILYLDLPYSTDQLVEACLETMRKNKLEAGYLRPIAFMGDGAMGLGSVNPTRVGIMAWPWGAYLGDEGLNRGIRVKISSFARMNANALMVRGKITGQYVNSVLAKREALLAGYDEAILLDSHGYVAEGTGENLFIVRDGKVFTPSLSSPVLEGITRNTVMRLARDEGLEVVETGFSRDTLYCADEVFLTGTAAELTPVREIDDRTIGNGAAGPVTKRIQEQFFKAVRGEDRRYAEWLSHY